MVRPLTAHLTRLVLLAALALAGVVVHGAGMEARDSTTGQPSSLRSTDGALNCYAAFRTGGERNESSTTGADYAATAGEWKSIIVNTNATGDVTVWPGKALVRLIRVRATNNAGTATANTAGIILVKDGSTVRDGAAAAKTPGATIYDGLDGTRFDTSVVLNFANIGDNPASGGKIEILLHTGDPRVTN